MNNAKKSCTTLEAVKFYVHAWLQDAETSKKKLAQFEKKGKIIELPVAMALPNTQSHLTHMFVREAYLTIYNNAREH